MDGFGSLGIFSFGGAAGGVFNFLLLLLVDFGTTGRELGRGSLLGLTGGRRARTLLLPGLLLGTLFFLLLLLLLGELLLLGFLSTGGLLLAEEVLGDRLGA